jgi:5-methylcytosine-specific restriction endonuclease McrA
MSKNKVSFSWKVEEKVLKKTGGHCAYCGDELSGNFDIDHVHPRAKGGSNADDNLMPACKWCNNKKRDKTVEEFRAVFFGPLCEDRKFYFERGVQS